MSRNDVLRARFGDLLASRDERLPNDGTHPLYSLTIKDGVTPKTDRYEREFLVTNKESKKYKVIRTGDLVFNPSNLRWGAIATSFVQFPVLASPIYEVFHPKDDSILDPFFLGALASSPMLMAKYLSLVEGTLVERTALKKDDFLEIEVEIPPLPEQKKIAEILSGIDKEISLLSLKKEKLEKTLTAYLGVAISGEGESIELQDLCKVTDGAHKTPTYTSSGVPFLRVTDIKAGDLDPSSFKYIPEEEHSDLIKRCKPEKGDVLLSKNGTIGIPRLIDWDWEFSIFVSLALLKIKDKNRLSPEFCEILLKSPLLISQIFATSKQGTVTNLHLEEIRKFRVCLPSHEKQLEIVREHKALCETICTYSLLVEKKILLKTALSSDLLSGRKRVSI